MNGVCDDDRAFVSARPRRSWITPLVAVAAVIAVSVAAVAVGTALLTEAGSAACRWGELREGSGYEKWEGFHIAEVRRLADERDVALDVETRGTPLEPPGTVLSISRCGDGRALLVTVAADDA